LIDAEHLARGNEPKDDLKEIIDLLNSKIVKIQSLAGAETIQNNTFTILSSAVINI